MRRTSSAWLRLPESVRQQASSQGFGWACWGPSSSCVTAGPSTPRAGLLAAAEQAWTGRQVRSLRDLRWHQSCCRASGRRGGGLIVADYKWPERGNRSLIGKGIPRVDGPVKVSGEAKYTYDLQPAGMLY